MNCSGRGVLVDPAAGLCLCDAAWNAGADLFDLRTDRSRLELQEDCLNPDGVVIFFWTVLLALLVVRYVHLVPVLKRRWGDAKRKPGGVLRDKPVRILLFDALAATPLSIVGACLKLSDRHNVILGTDVAFTITFLLGILGINVMWGEFQIMQFHVLVTSNYLSDTAWRRRILTLNFWCQRGLGLSYMLSIAPTFVALGLDKSLGPIQSGEYIILIVRNIGVVLWQFFAFAGYYFMYRQVDALQSSVQASGGAESASSNAPGPGPGPASPTSASKLGSPVVVRRNANNVVEVLRANLVSNAKKNLLALVVYTLFSIPFAWPYQTYAISFAACLLAVAMHPAKVLRTAQRAAQDTSNLASPASNRVKLEGQLGGGSARNVDAVSPQNPARVMQQGSTGSLMQQSSTAGSEFGA